MIRIELTQGEEKLLAARLEAAAAALGLTLNAMDQKAGGHWHLNKAGSKGTLGATYTKGILWLETRANRDGPWIENAVSQLRERFA